MTGKKKLGRGLDALLGKSNSMASILGSRANVVKPSHRAISSAGDADSDGSLKIIPIDLIQRGKFQPRTDMHEDALQDLANSIKSQGVLQPIVVRPISSSKYEIIAGERRWRACQLAGLDTIPSIIKPVSDESAIVIALIENIQRENLNPIEEARALKRLQDEFELTQQEVADAIGKSRATVTNLMRLISLNLDVQKMLEHGDLENGHARALLSLSEIQQSEAAKVVVGKGLSVRQTEALVRNLLANASPSKTPGPVDPDIRILEDNLSEKLGAVVLIQHTAKGKGKLILKYNSLEELDGILAHIR